MAAAGNGYATATTGLYKCIRDDMVAVFPQKIRSNAPVADNAVKAFYGVKPEHNGQINVDFGCCGDISNPANCGAWVYNNGAIDLP